MVNPRKSNPSVRQGSCKVSVTRPDLRLWRPAAEVERPEAPLRLHLQGEHLTRAQVRATCGRSLDATAPCRHRIAASLRRHPSRSTACLTTLHEPWVFPLAWLTPGWNRGPLGFS